MNEWIDQALERAAAGETLVVCTLVATRGSTPQRPGAVMLVLESGHTCGTIGGGCVEAEVCQRALAALVAFTGGDDRLLRFTLDQDYGWDDGLVCGGVMDVAVEAMPAARVQAVFGDMPAALARGAAARRTITAVDDAGQRQTFEHQVEPPPRLVIAGAGHVGAALAPLARGLGFDVTVVDDRPDAASAERFPCCTRVAGAIPETLSKVPLGPNAYVVIVTRGHRHDGQALAAVVERDARYVGLIGSKRKVREIYGVLLDDGSATAEQLARVHAPIGLAVGAVTPEEIAVSIAAELTAVRRGATIDPAGRMGLSADQFAAAVRGTPAP